MKFNPGMWLTAICVQCAATGSLAANPELVDYSCPTSPNDQPAVFEQGTQALTFPGVVHIEDRSQNYQLTFTPRYDAAGGYFDTILIVGVKYTLNPATQAKTYIFDKEKIRQQIVDIPINYCRSHRIPYAHQMNTNLGEISIADEGGRKKTSIVSLYYVKNGCGDQGCNIVGLAALYRLQNGDLANVQFGQGAIRQDIRIMQPLTP